MWIQTPVVIEGRGVVLKTNCQVSILRSINPPHECWNICNSTATHKWTDGMPMCEWHYNSWLQQEKDEKFLAEIRKGLRPQLVKSVYIDSLDNSDQERMGR